MNEVERIADELARAHAGDPWHGSSARAGLAGVTAKQAAARPIANAHTIWEIVGHVTGWRREVARRRAGGFPALPAGGDWPEMPDHPTDAAWAAALADFDAAHRELTGVLARLDPDSVENLVGGDRSRELGSGVSWYVMLHGVSQHDAYHMGQVALLRKLTAGP